MTRCAAWPQLWEDIKAARPFLVIVDPVSAALADADTSQTGPARTFLREVSQEAATAGCGVLLVAHDTKSARNLAMAGQDPGAGAVAGSAAWYDGARGVLTLVPDPAARGSRLLVAIKANYGRDRMGSAFDGAVRGRPIPRPGAASADGCGRSESVARRRRGEPRKAPQRPRGGGQRRREAWRGSLK